MIEKKKNLEHGENKVARNKESPKKNESGAKPEAVLSKLEKEQAIAIAKQGVIEKYPPDEPVIVNTNIEKAKTPGVKSETGKVAKLFKKFTNMSVAASVLISSLFPNLAKGATADETFTGKEKNKVENRDDINKLKAEVVKTADRVQIKLANYFETDKANISPEDAKEMLRLISQYTDNLDMSNVDEFLKKEVTLRVSCDPRPTNSYENGNVGLAEARAKEAMGIIKSYNIENSNLTQEKLKSVKEKLQNIGVDIPPGGVIDYHQLNYSTEQWAELNKPGNESKLLEAYKNMRFVTLELAIPNQKTPEVKDSTSLEKAQNVKLLLDLSSSMNNDRQAVAKEIESLNQEKPFEIIGFASTIEGRFTVKNSKEAAQKILELKSSRDGKEYAIDIAIKVLSEKNEFSFKSNENNLMIWQTDEELQNVTNDNLTRLESIAREQNINFEIRMRTKEGIKVLSLEDIRTIFDTYYQEKLKENITRLTANVEDTKKYISELKSYIEDEKNIEKNLNEKIAAYDSSYKINKENLEQKIEKLDKEYKVIEESLKEKISAKKISTPDEVQTGEESLNRDVLIMEIQKLNTRYQEDKTALQKAMTALNKNYRENKIKIQGIINTLGNNKNKNIDLLKEEIATQEYALVNTYEKKLKNNTSISITGLEKLPEHVGPRYSRSADTKMYQDGLAKGNK